MTFTCASCRWSMGGIEGLYCGKQDKQAFKVCRSFEYEPGTDERETAARDSEVCK